MAAKGHPKSVEGQTQIAAIIEAHFKASNPEFKCRRQYIVEWGKPTRNRPNPFPKPSDANRFDVASCLAWVEENIIKAKADLSGEELRQAAADAVARKKIRLDEEHEFDFAVKRGEFVKCRDAEIAAIGLAKRFQAITREEIRAAFLKIDVILGEQLIDRLDMKYEEASRE